MTNNEHGSGFGSFVAEMRRRHVVRFTLGYAAAAFVVLQLAEIVFPAFGIGEIGLRVLVVTVTLGFLPAVVLAWLYDITTEGIRRTEDDPLGVRTMSRTALLALFVVAVGVAGGAGAYLVDQGVFEPSGADAPGEPSLAVYDPGEPIRSIAVLPLDDFSAEGGQAYLTSGIHEEVIAKLSMLDGLRVVSRTSVMQYAGTTKSAPEIGRELGVDALVEGSVNRSGDRVRITLQIIHAPSDSHIETLQFDREIDDVLALQTEVAHALVHEIETAHEEEMFAQTAANISMDAQEAYLRGKMEYGKGTPEGYRMALEYFQQALEAEPEFAPAMAGAAGARFLVGLEDADYDVESLERARSQAIEAVALDTASVDAKEVLAYIERSLPRLTGTEVVAVPAPPGQSHVLALTGSGDSVVIDMSAFDTTWISAMTTLGERIEEKVRVRSMPLSEVGMSRLTLEARQLMGSGRYAEATRVLEDAVEISPDAPMAWEMLTRSHVASGNVTAAAAAVRAWSESGGVGAPDVETALRLEDAVEFEGERGFWAWTLDRLRAREAGGDPAPRVEWAAAHAGLGDRDEAFAYLYDALEQGERGLLSLRFDPVWDELRSDARFADLAREVRAIRFAPTRRPPRSPIQEPGR